MDPHTTDETSDTVPLEVSAAEDQNNVVVTTEKPPAPANDSETKIEPLKITPAKHRFSRKYIIAGLLVILAFALGVFGTLLYTKSTQKNDQKNNSNQASSGAIISTNRDKTPTTPVKETVTWLEVPTKMALQPVFTDQWFKDAFQDGSKKEDVEEFYLIGTIGTDQIIVALINDGMGSQTMLLKKSGDSYTLYQQHSADAFYATTEGGEAAYQGPTLTPAVKIDKTSQIAEIVAPSPAKINGQDHTLSKYGAMGIDFISTKEPSSQYLQYTAATTVPEGKIYEVVSKDDPTYKISYFSIMTKDHRMHPYVIDGTVYASGVTPITWNNGSKNTDIYTSAVAGCGYSGSIEVAKNITDASITAIGKTSDGTTVYALKDANNALVAKHYAEYKMVTSYENNLPTDEKNMTQAQFVQKNGIFLVKDVSGRWLVMAKQNYFPSGGCAKPVVYLYPSVTTIANVSVGAAVTKSEPFYPAGGWKTVLAQSDGSLRYQGKAYDSLFWEGFGNGAYPVINSGTFVKHAAVETTIKSNLAAQGLNAKEINDFWTFWAAKVPNTEYVRITWLSKQQLQLLAPLQVSPTPTTVIRVFLDMEGSSTTYPLDAQHFITPKRTGFTVVEWGGLARDGSVPTLR